MIGIPVARIGGIEVRVQLGWIIVVALVAALAVGQVGSAAPELGGAVQWTIGLLVGVGFFLSAMTHDLAHALTAKRRGVEVGSIVVSFFGGTTPLDPASDDPRAELAIAASGPIVSTLLGAALAGIGLLVGTTGPAVALAAGQLLAVLGVLNLLLGLVNLLPSYPLDGGRIVKAIGWRRRGVETDGWRAAASTGRATGGVLVVGGVAGALGGQGSNAAMVVLCGWFLILSSRAIRERVRVEALIGGVTVGDAMEHDVSTVHANLTLDTIAGQLMDADNPVTVVPVLDGSTVEGIVSAGQVRRIRRGRWGETRVGEMMARPPRLPFLAPGETLVSAVERLQRAGLDGAPVLEDGRLVGVLTRRSIGAAVAARGGVAGPGGRSAP